MERKKLISIVMGSQSDWKVLSHSEEIIKKFRVSYEKKIISAHRTPERLYDYAKSIEQRGIEVVIAGAGGAAHLPGMVAALSSLPVFGVPIESKSLKGLDSLLSIVQMPAGIPVSTLAIGKPGAINASLACLSVLGNKYPSIKKKLVAFRIKQTNSIKKTPHNVK